MNTNIKRLLGCACALSIASVTTDSYATAIATTDISIDWTSMLVSADPSLTLTPNAGFYADTAHLGVLQAWFDNVSIPSNDLPHFNYQPPATPLSVAYSKIEGSGTIQASGTNDSLSGQVSASASDNDGNPYTSNLINSNVTRQLRYDVSGSGVLSLSFDYDMALQTSVADPTLDYAKAFGWVIISVQEYALNDNGQYDYVGLYQNQIWEELLDSSNQDAFFLSGTLSLDLPFSNVTNQLVLIQMTGQSQGSAASGIVTSSIPEPATLALIAVGLFGLSFGRSKHIR